MTTTIVDTEYQAFLADIKQHYRSAQLKAAYAVNREMIQFYWHLGKQIIEKQATAAWGASFWISSHEICKLNSLEHKVSLLEILTL